MTVLSHGFNLLQFVFTGSLRVLSSELQLPVVSVVSYWPSRSSRYLSESKRLKDENDMFVEKRDGDQSISEDVLKKGHDVKGAVRPHRHYGSQSFHLRSGKAGRPLRNDQQDLLPSRLRWGIS